ncbi:MAG: PD-(D/E)XK nuclease family protein [Elusimicrobia bacterium]|nr:PD-(D/E)XK nuclease family protein [Elusimicrobiota bacterium]
MKRTLSTLLSAALVLQGLPAAAQSVARGGVSAPVTAGAVAGAVPTMSFALGAGPIVTPGDPTLALRKPLAVGGQLALGQAAMRSGPAPGQIAVGASANRQELAGAAARPSGEGQRKPGSIGTLLAVQQAHQKAGRPKGSAADVALGMGAFDGAGTRFSHRDEASPVVGPAFEPPMPALPGPERPQNDDEGGGEGDKRLKLSFPTAMKSGLLSYEPTLAINAKISRVREFDGSRDYWKQFKKGVEIDVVSKDEDVFGRPTKITRAVTKRIADLSRDDFRGTVPAHQLKAGVRSLRASLVSSLEEKRRSWNPADPMVTANTRVRVVEFQSYLDLYRETHGKDSVPKPEPPAPRSPLVVDASDPRIAPLSRFLPRAVFLDLDMLDGPLSPEILSDMAKLQRTGVYFVALSRKPYAAAGAIKERLIRQMSSYQLGVLMPIRFMMVTDDGAVISELPKGGNVVPVEVEAFSDAQMDVFRDAARKAAEEAGLSTRGVKELAQPRIDDYADEIPGLARRKKAQTRQPNVRFKVSFPKTATAAQLKEWRAQFETRLAAQGLSPKLSLAKGADGAHRFTAQKTDLASSMPRLLEALGAKYGLYLNPGDALVLTDDPALQAANPGTLDFGGITGLKGAALIENALGVALAEHRENHEGDLAGSASRMASFTRDRHRYLSERLIDQDKEEQNINFFSGHAVHAANDWLIYEVQNGRRPTKEQFAAHMRAHWEEGLLEVKPIGLPQGQTMTGWLEASVERALGMYDFVLAAADRGELLIGTEIPNFFVVKDYERRTGNVKRRYILHTIFDFVTLRPDPKGDGTAKVVIYDFKSGPTKTRGKLNKDLQVMTYSLFAHEKWYGRDFPVPYLAGGKSLRIDDVGVEFIYNAVKQITTVNARDRDKIRKKIITVLNGIHAAEQKMLGLDHNPAKTTKAKADKKPTQKKRSSK